MLVLLLSWFVSWSVCCSLGWRFLKDSGVSLFRVFIYGLGLLLLITQFWALFLPLRYLGMLLLPYTLFEWIAGSNKQKLKEQLQVYAGWKNLLLLATCLLPAVIPSWINDDMSYYTQSIQWYAGEGWVQGLGNLNIRYALGSSWHSLSAVFYQQGILPDRIWNFNGLLLFLFLVELRGLFNNEWLLLPALVLGIPFVNAPSPDLPLMVVTAFVLFRFAELKVSEWMMLLALVIGLKATALSVLIFGIIPLVRYKKRVLAFLWLPSLAFMLYLVKSYLLSGHWLFPLSSGWDQAAWAVPEAYMQEFRNGVLAEIYGLGYSAADWLREGYGVQERMLGLFMLKPYKVIMNVLILLSTVLLAAYHRKIKSGGIPLVSLLIVLGVLLWWMSAPNYRFLLGLPVAGLTTALMILDRKTVLLKLPALAALVCMLGFSVAMNTLGLKQLHLVACGTPAEMDLSQVIYPVPFPAVTYVHTEQPFNNHNPSGCIYCGNVPVPCYPDTVRHFNEKAGMKLLYDAGTWRMEGGKE